MYVLQSFLTFEGARVVHWGQRRDLQACLLLLATFAAAGSHGSGNKENVDKKREV